MNSLLPLNSTCLERAIEHADDEQAEVPLRKLYNPQTCPAHLLHQLAWAWSVDRWDDAWADAVKRSVIRSAFFVHARKGTLGALKRVVEPFGYVIEIVEWFRLEPPGVRGTFALKVGVSNGGISEETYRELSALLDDARPVSRHMIGLEISLETLGAFYIGAAAWDGDTLDVYPPASNPVEVLGVIGRGGREITLDIMDITHG
ncbi:MAG: phage tail protein I [Pseudomonas farsensis]|uniref:phage tail protein I n=1 Tax=Pseudomonas farsensis TaxID=2745492 RepID=UPI003C7E3157